MNNRQINEAWKYHSITKHPGMPPHYLDWENKPIPFKIYTSLEGIEIPKDLPYSNVPALDSISKLPTDKDTVCIPDLTTLGRLIFLCAGITKKVEHPSGDFYFRAAACTGALYHIDLYIVTGDIKGLDAGVYHFGPHDFSLRRLRKGDFRGLITETAAQEESVARAPVIYVFTSSLWRNSWKYQSRTYRHTFWDNGTILANLLALASAYRIPAKIVMGFVDLKLNQLLGLDTYKEVVVSLVSIGNLQKSVSGKIDVLEEIKYELMPLSKNEIDYPRIRAIHLASSLKTEDEVKEWRIATIEPPAHELHGKQFPLDIDEEKVDLVSNTIEKTILKRGSTRQFARVSITFRQLSNLLYRSTRGIHADFIYTPGTSLNDIYLIVNYVEEIPKGSYYYSRNNNVLELLKEGDFRRNAGHLGLGQDLPQDSSVNVFFLSDLNIVLKKFGNRGYRAAQLEAGIIGGKLYLGAYGLGLGASGLTFFDDEVTKFFSPHAQGKSTMFLIALGKSIKTKLGK